MSLTGRLTAAVGGAALAAALMTVPAFAETSEETGPETPENNAELPIVQTSRGSAHLKANTLNPRPVCNAWEDTRTVIYEVRDNFTPVGTVSATNRTDHTIPLTQETSKSQTISVTVNGSRTEQTDVNIGGGADKKGENSSASGQWGIAYSLTQQLGAEASYQLSWTVGQTVGPYDVPAGHTGEATYGFRTIAMTGTQQYCTLDGTWSTPTAWRANVPIKNEVQVKLYDNPVGSRP